MRIQSLDLGAHHLEDTRWGPCSSRQLRLHRVQTRSQFENTSFGREYSALTKEQFEHQHQIIASMFGMVNGHQAHHSGSYTKAHAKDFFGRLQADVRRAEFGGGLEVSFDESGGDDPVGILEKMQAADAILCCVSDGYAARPATLMELQCARPARPSDRRR